MLKKKENNNEINKYIIMTADLDFSDKAPPRGQGRDGSFRLSGGDTLICKNALCTTVYYETNTTHSDS